MDKSFDYHYQFHQILGHITTIKSAISIIKEDYHEKIDPEVYKMVKYLSNNIEELINDVQNLRKKVYTITDSKQK